MLKCLRQLYDFSNFFYKIAKKKFFQKYGNFKKDSPNKKNKEKINLFCLYKYIKLSLKHRNFLLYFVRLFFIYDYKVLNLTKYSLILIGSISINMYIFLFRFSFKLFFKKKNLVSYSLIKLLLYKAKQYYLYVFGCSKR